jgi:uncharacterized protein (TIGR02147 family)
MDTKEKNRPEIYRYTDYRKYLRDLFEYTKDENPDFSFRSFSSAAGYSSSGILKEVMNGSRKLPLKRIKDFMRPFNLTDKEQLFFEKLVLFNEVKDEAERSNLFRELIRLKRKPGTRKLTAGEARFYEKWYYCVVRELVTFPDFKEDPRWIAAQTSPRIMPGQAQEALQLLLELGFLKRDGKGALAQAEPKLDVDPDELIQSVREFSRSMIELGWESIERFDPKHREVSGLTLAMSAECYAKVKDMVRHAQDEIFDYVCKDPGQTELVCRLNTELFPLVSRLERKTR